MKDDEATHGQKRLGEVYTAVVGLLASRTDHAIVKAELAKLVKSYGKENVEWVIGVIRNDANQSPREEE